MYSNFKEQAIEYVRQAVAEDNAGNYAKAFPLYMNALEYFRTQLKFETNPKIKEAITQKFTEYLRRAEEIRVVLEEGGSGPSSNGDGAVATRPKSKPKDGNDGEDGDMEKLRFGLNSAIIREKPNFKWNDVAGLESAKQALQEAVILPVKFPQFFTETMPPCRRQRQRAASPPSEDEIFNEQERQPRAPRQLLTDEIEPSEWDDERFPSLECQERYFELRNQRTVIPERGIGHEYLEDDRLQPILQWLGWEQFATHPMGNGSLRLALEFFAQFSDQADMRRPDAEMHIWIRDVELKVSASRINQVLGVSNDRPDIRYPEITPEQCQVVGQALGTIELNPANANEFRTAHMNTPWKELARLWLGRIIPNSRDHFISFSRAQFIYDIARGVRPNLGLLIYHNMYDIATTPRLSITYVHLITQFCRNWGVPVTDDECDFRPGGHIKILGFSSRRTDIADGKILPAILIEPEGPVPTDEFILQQPPPPIQDVPPPHPQRDPNDVLARLDDMQRQSDERWAILDERWAILDERWDISTQRWTTYEADRDRLEGRMEAIQDDLATLLSNLARPQPPSDIAGPSQPAPRRGRRGT